MHPNSSAGIPQAVAMRGDDGAFRLVTLDGPPPEPHKDWLDLTGAEESVAALRGRIIVVNFWATWCAPCIEEMPVLNGIQTACGPLGVQVIGIGADDSSHADKVLRFARKTGLTFPLWLGATTTDMASFEVGPALPATVVIDRDGHVVHRVHGVVEEDALREVLDRVVRVSGSNSAASVLCTVSVDAGQYRVCRGWQQSRHRKYRRERLVPPKEHSHGELREHGRSGTESDGGGPQAEG
jgi:thiol-disulfide isomerase/thioredoxin